MYITSEYSTLNGKKYLMAKRIRNWIDKPESDLELTEMIINSGKLEDLKVFLKNETEK